MRYSLLSRFRGALLGSFIGEMLFSEIYQKHVFGSAKWGRLPARGSQDGSRLSDWSQIATSSTESLIRCGGLDLEDLLLECGTSQPSLLSLKNTADSSQLAVATLPIALFFHEDLVKLRQQLLKKSAVWQRDSQESEGALAVAYAIALALTEKLDFAQLIPQTLAYLGASQTPLGLQLGQVQMLLEQGAGLERVLTEMRCYFQQRQEPRLSSEISIALAFYCFLSTPEDFRLCVIRATRTGYQPQITAALTGALSGAYNSIMGIPVVWRLATDQLGTGLEKLDLADRLLAVWSGVYDVSTQEHFQDFAVAAPRVMGHR